MARKDPDHVPNSNPPDADPFHADSVREVSDSHKHYLERLRLLTATILVVCVFLFLIGAYYYTRSPTAEAHLLGNIMFLGGSAVGYLWGRMH